MLLAGAPGGAEATLGQRGAEALAGPEGASHTLGGMSVDPWRSLAESEGGLPRWPNRRKRGRQAEPSSGCRATSARSRSCPSLARRQAPVPTLKSTVIPALPDETTQSSQQQQQQQNFVTVPKSRGHTATQASVSGVRGKHGPEPLLGFCWKE
ncbi:unnamed protein product [Gulo gulo]|uniref:Uncharacterized protein n=1 Tax=Gulo gulo TaxID=48420 RepID=A0A9X9M6M0_GULGU|nr:unnamed protein product [Gulo gulo]